ncbi:hypothetical protein BU26DRAFT_424511 [Trematosphaeria pertusa]|uniref:Ferritin-like domain-containing protein n=1 Tax=Trematosphaeria pertusa TaxID=390896 RepID=A0A6A6IP23_9PLEO|nr:uncharacterized protein BU26DRAFT_424511 [Trematosphaeria pertusa]KAF2251243.1 hypothetical protein BU26DRAFT_424511 [Trematosphaeria pertusa]
MPNITDVDILQYALTLEHLEDKFYREGLANFTLEHFKKAGYDDTFYNNLKEVSYDETTHVSFLTQALIAANATPVQECTYAFSVPSVPAFLATASILEGVGVSAYLGAAASIMQKAYLTAAGSILTVESRHSAYLRAAGTRQAPFPQAFDAPLTLDQVYTLAAPFIVACPAANGMLPVKAFPVLSLAPECGGVRSNGTIALVAREAVVGAGPWFAAWIGVEGPTFVPATLEGEGRFVTVVPPGFHGQSYVVVSKQEGCVTDDCVVAGPAVVEVVGANGMAV